MGRRLLIASAAPTLVIAMAACGSSSTTSSGSASPSPATCPGDSAPASGATITIEARDFCLSPSALKLTAGQAVTITFVNRGAVAHNLTLGGTDLATAQVGETKTVTYTAPSGATGFFCKFHQVSKNMIGTLAVAGTGGAPPSTAPSTAPTMSSGGGGGYGY